MNTGRYQGQIVVGTDGSAAADRALDVAARAASLRSLPLTLLLAVPPGRTPTTDFGSTSMVNGLLDRGRAALDDSANRLCAAYPHLSVDTDLMAADAAAALVGASQSAELVVVGARGRNLPLVTQLLGGTADAVITHAHGPVLVVPATADPLAEGPVVIGADESHESQAALRPAFESAALRGVDVLALCAWDLHPADAEFFDERALGALEQAVAATVSAMADEFPGVEATTKLVRGRPASVLVEASEHASLVAVGSRGFGGFRGLLLGSVSREVARAAKCPVLVVRRRT